MNAKILSLLLVLPMLTFCGTNKVDPEPDPEPGPGPDPEPTPVVVDPKITLNGEAEISMGFEGGTATISFTANRDWTVTATDFLHAEPKSGVASETPVTVTITCEANPGTESRNAVVTITADTAKETVKVKQGYDVFVNAAQEVKNGDVILVTNEKVQAFLENVHYPERDYSVTHIQDPEYGPTCPGDGRSDKPQEYSIRWTADESAGDLTLDIREGDGWSRKMSIDKGECYVNIINLRPNAHYTYKVTGASGKEMTAGEFDTKGLVYQVLFKANVRNARDLGGWKTKDGKTVKYRMIYRGGRLQASTLTSKKGKEDLKAQGILAQLDLRGHSDVLSKAALDYMDFCAPVIEEGYLQMLRDDGPKVKQCFEFIAQCVKDNKPVYYHCSLGRDRTGTISMILLGVLGVDEGDISKEYELTQFAPFEWATSGGETTKMTRRADYKGAANYIWNNFVGEGETFAQGMEKYLRSIDVAQETIDEFRSNMLIN